MFSKTSKPDDNVRPVERTTTTTTTTTTIQKQERANPASRETVSRVIATLATPVVHFSRVVRDGFLDDVERRVVLHLTLLGALARPWTLVTCQLVSPTVLEIPAIVGLVFLVEILLKRAYVGSRVVCELLLTTAVVTGGLYVLFDAFHRTVISGEEAGTPLALGPHSLVGGALVLCQKLKNDLSDEDTVRRAARYGPVWFLLGAVFIGGEIDREERVFGCALFGVVGGHVYFHARGRFKVLGMHVASTRTARTKSSNVDNAISVASSE